jgi:hypothetical protein
MKNVDLKKLENLMANKVMAGKVHHTGIAIEDLSNMLTNNQKKEIEPQKMKIVIIPSGISKENLDRFRTMSGVNIANGIDNTYVSNDESFTKFVHTIETIKPTLIVAGSRGAELVARLLKDVSDKYKGKILLFGAVQLTQVFEANNNNLWLVLVHGVKDSNEQINSVRGLVAAHKKAKLIEAKDKGHNLIFEESVLANVIRYVYSI